MERSSPLCSLRFKDFDHLFQYPTDAICQVCTPLPLFVKMSIQYQVPDKKNADPEEGCESVTEQEKG